MTIQDSQDFINHEVEIRVIREMFNQRKEYTDLQHKFTEWRASDLSGTINRIENKLNGLIGLISVSIIMLVVLHHFNLI